MTETVVIGAGPAGLAAAYELRRRGHAPRVVERDQLVGGISRTVRYNGYRFDIGGHRFFTKVPEIQAFWEEILAEDFLERPRLSRIHYRDRFFDYPLKPLNALVGLGPIEALRVGLSYIKARTLPHPQEHSFEQWVSNRFGYRLYEIFFKTYTEKVWGIPCSEISADWAAQRIKNLDLVKALRNALVGDRGKGEVISTLIDRFHYPRFGPGMMWEHCCDRLEQQGVRIELETRAERIHLDDAGRVTGVTLSRKDGRREKVASDHIVSSMPLTELIRSLEPSPPAEVLGAADRLSYRDFLIVVLIVDREQVFPDNWIYIHSPEVAMGRVQNFKNWSPEMVPDPAKTSLGLEYFVTVGDRLWTQDDAALVELGIEEMTTLGLIERGEVEDGTVLRMPKAYPVYDGHYRASVDTIRRYVEALPNLHVVGRNGQHRYNNQDHSMLSGILAARNILGERHDIWAINVDTDYLEETSVESRRGAERGVPQPLDQADLEPLLHDAFARYDPIALGAAVGGVGGLGLFLATAILLLKSGDPVGPNLSLLGVYLQGFEVTWSGALLGTLEATAGGFLLGALMAKLINLLVGAFEESVRRELEMTSILDPLEARD